MVKLSAVNRTTIGSSPIINATIPEWWNGIHSGLRNRVERRVGSSPTEGTNILSRSLMAGHQILTLGVQVRVLTGQHLFF